MASLTKVKLNNIDTSVTFIYDPLVLLNYGSTLANTDIGFVFNRDGGISSNVALFWNESNDRLTVAYTNANGLPNSNIAITKYANVAADWYFGNLAGGTTNTVWVSANVLPTANAFYNFGSPTQRWNVGYFAATTLDLGGSQISVDPTNGFKFTIGGTGTPIYLASNGLISGSTISSAGAITAAGAINTSANVLASQVSAGSVVTTGLINAGGNILATGGVFSALNVNGNLAVGSIATPGAGHSIVGNVVQSGAGTVWINTPGNLLAALGRFGQISSDGLINTSANVMGAIGKFGSITSTGFINTSANISAATYIGGQVVVSSMLNTAGNVLTKELDVFGNAQIGSLSTAGVVHDIIGNVRQSGAGTVFFNTTGNIMAAIGRFGSISTDGYINTSANISTAQLNAGQINTTGNVLSVGGVFNSITVNGTALVQNLNSTTNVLAQSATVNSLTVNGATSATGFINTTANISAATIIAGAMTTTGTLRAAIVNSTGNVLGTAGIFNALTVNGNETVTGFLNVTGNIIGAVANFSTIESSGMVRANSTASAGSTTTGAIVTAGGIGVAKDSYFGGNVSIDGNLFVHGNVTFFSSNDIVFSDALIYLADDNPADILDIGFVSSFTNPGYQHTGLVRDASDGVWKLFANVASEPTTTVDFTNATYSSLLIGNLLADQATVTGLNSAGFINTSGNVSAATVRAGAVTSTGYINTSGNISTAQLNAGQINTTGNVLASTVRASFLTASTVAVGNISAVTIGNASATITGGFLNITGNALLGQTRASAINSTPIGNATASTGAFTTLSATQTFYANSTTASTTTTTGAIVVAGGVGVGGNITAGSLATPGSQLTFDGNVIINGFGAIQIPAGTTLQRPGSTTAGQLRYNTDTNQFEGYGNAWAALGGGGGGTPGGVSTAIQYNNGGAFGGIPTFNYILANNAILMTSGLSSTTTGTGALQVVGGVGITENINAGGSITATGAVNAGGNILASQVSAGSVITTGVGNFGGNILSTGAIHNSLTVNGNIAVGTPTIPGVGHTIVGNVTQSGPGTTYFNIVGNILAADAKFGTLGLTGTLSSSAFINTTANVSAAIGNFGAINSTGFINTSGNVSASTVRAGQINTTGNVLSTAGVFNSLTVNGGITSTGFINTSANISGATVLAGTITTSGTLTAATVNATGNVLAQAGVFNGLTVNGNETVTGFLNVTGNIIAANINAGGVRQTTSDTVPAIKTVGDQWYDTSSDTLFQYVYDGTSFVWVDISGQPLNVNIGTVQGTSLSITGSGTVSGNLNVGGRLVGTATQALYADLAEKYTADAVYTPGTVLVFGGSKEVTQSTTSHDTAIAGVVSTNPAYLMNSGQEGVSVALTGRVPCWVTGPINKGDRVVSSDKPGVAECLDITKYQPGCIIGKSLETIVTKETKLIEVVVGRI